MNVNIDEQKFEYEIKELIKAFGILEEYGDFSLEEINQKIVTKLSIDEKTYINSVDFNLKDKKLLYKQEAYKALSNFTQKTLPWGILTGIRPVKLVNKLKLENGILEDIKLYNIFKDCYFIADSKINDMLNISKTQNKIINDFDINKGISIYIGIPFCPSRCNYCSFFSTDIKKTEKLVRPYIENLLEEIDLVKPYLKDKLISSLYFGGGTPSSLNSEDIRYLLEEVNKRFPFDSIDEVCFEAGRPDTLSAEKLKVIKENGVDRISINPQTMNDDTLEKIGRNHNSEDIKRTYAIARNLGFTNINMDIILGLEGETVKDVEHTMKEIEKLCPDSITVHTLSKKRASKLTEDGICLEDNDISEQMEIARLYSSKMSLEPYYLYRQKGIKGNLENLGLATKGKASIYNIAIMEEIQSIIAFGAGGMTKVFYEKENRLERVENVKSLEEYLNRNKEMADRKIRELSKED